MVDAKTLLTTPPTEVAKPGAEPISLADFLANSVPMTAARVVVNYRDYHIVFPELLLYCEEESCQGMRVFGTDASHGLNSGSTAFIFLHYECKNCSISVASYAFSLSREPNTSFGMAYKFGQFPRFGPRTPTKLANLVGSERDLFFKGQRAEAQGLGIAAFAYYRRVIENQRNAIFSRIIKVAKVVGGSDELIADLERAKAETQFSKGVDAIKHALPQALLIRGQNPLLLLHGALSEGLHAQDDQECLELAHSVRLVLTDFVERVANALSDDRELGDAVNRLMRNVKPKSSGTG